MDAIPEQSALSPTEIPMAVADRASKSILELSLAGNLGRSSAAIISAEDPWFKRLKLPVADGAAVLLSAAHVLGADLKSLYLREQFDALTEYPKLDVRRNSRVFPNVARLIHVDILTDLALFEVVDRSFLSGLDPEAGLKFSSKKLDASESLFVFGYPDSRLGKPLLSAVVELDRVGLRQKIPLTTAI